MQLQEENILMFTRSMDVGGTENMILKYCDVLKDKVAKIVVCSCGGVNVEKLNTMGIKHYLIPDIAKNSPQIAITVYRTIKKIIEQEGINVVHCHHRKAAFYMQFARKKEIKVIATAHGIFSDKRFLTRFSYRNIKIIACGEVVKKNLIDYFGLKNVIVIRNVVSRDESRPILVKELCCRQGFKVAYIGRIAKEKGVEYLLKAINIVKDMSPTVCFVIVGDGPERKKIEAESTDLKIGENMIFLGYRNDIQNVIKQIDVVVLPSLTEGFPLTPIEAFAQGKPVIATSVGGSVEIVHNDSNGLLVHSKNENELAEAIIRMAKDYDFYSRCAQNARLTYDKEYTVNTFKEEIIFFYENL